MNVDDRLRRLLGGLDAGPGFEARVMERVAGLAAAAPREDLRAQFERRRALLRRRLLREAWMSSITILGLGACGGALLWRYASEIQQFATNSGQSVDPNLLIGGTAAVVGTALWFLIRRARG
ncbi:MAG: hypothetical protein HW417_231 [Steroidobacteraceae bacterium]|nr:hypothetical protein [Steroidobacteraceae bacterium]